MFRGPDIQLKLKFPCTQEAPADGSHATHSIETDDKKNKQPDDTDHDFSEGDDKFLTPIMDPLKVLNITSHLFLSST